LGDFEVMLSYQIVRKCVVAEYNSLLSSFIVTALTNTLEKNLENGKIYFLKLHFFWGGGYNIFIMGREDRKSKGNNAVINKCATNL
jgi:hypothetical protein